MARKSRSDGERTRALILDAIRTYLDEHSQRPPAYRNIAEMIGRSRSTVAQEINVLIADGRLIRIADGGRAVTLPDAPVPPGDEVVEDHSPAGEAAAEDDTPADDDDADDAK